VSLNDQADREPRTLSEGEVLDIGGKRLRWIPTPHVPHGWDAGLLFEETTGTLFAGDLFTMTGRSAVASDADIVERAIATEDLFNGTALTADTGATIRSLATLGPKAMALMHGPLFTGDGAAALTALGDDYDRRVGERIAARDS
jgi:flavorubredoxin